MSEEPKYVEPRKPMWKRILSPVWHATDPHKVKEQRDKINRLEA